MLKTDNNNTSALSITRDTANLFFFIKSGTITIDGQEKGIIIDGTYSSTTKSIIIISDNAKVTLNNLTLKNNNSTGNGEAISQTTSTLTLNNCTITNNSAKYGCGIISAKEESILNLNNTNITNNTATNGSGGGMRINGTATMTGGEIKSNKSYEYGAGVDFSPGFFTYSNVSIENNTNTSTGETVVNNIQPDLDSPNNID